MKTSVKNICKQFTRVAAAAALVGAGGVQASIADGFVDSWTVGVVGEFVCPATFTGSGPTTCTDTSLKWGTPFPPNLLQSGLELANAPASEVLTDGPSVANIAVTHNNHPIFIGNSLDVVTLLSTLTLTPSDPAGVGFPPLPLAFMIDFLETPNFPSSGICADGGAQGVGVNSAGCADIFVIDQQSLNFPFEYDLGLGHGPKTYFISFFEQTNGLNPLSPQACAAVGVASPCLGFETPEGASTMFQFAAVITTAPVVIIPVPGTMAVMGLGLLLLGAIRRRRNS